MFGKFFLFSRKAEVVS